MVPKKGEELHVSKSSCEAWRLLLELESTGTYYFYPKTLLSTKVVDPDPERTDTGLAREISLFTGANVGNVDFELTRKKLTRYFFSIVIIQHCSQ